MRYIRKLVLPWRAYIVIEAVGVLFLIYEGSRSQEAYALIMTVITGVLVPALIIFFASTLVLMVLVTIFTLIGFIGSQRGWFPPKAEKSE